LVVHGRKLVLGAVLPVLAAAGRAVVLDSLAVASHLENVVPGERSFTSNVR